MEVSLVSQPSPHCGAWAGASPASLMFPDIRGAWQALRGFAEREGIPNEPPHLASDKDAFLQERRGNRAKLPRGQEGEGNPVPGSPLLPCMASVRLETSASLSFFMSEMG